MSLAKAKADLAEISQLNDYVVQNLGPTGTAEQAKYIYEVQVLKFLSSIANSLVHIAEKTEGPK